MNQSSTLKRAHTTRRKGPGAQGQGPLLKALFVFLLVERDDHRDYGEELKSDGWDLIIGLRDWVLYLHGGFCVLRSRDVFYGLAPICLAGIS